LRNQLVMESQREMIRFVLPPFINTRILPMLRNGTMINIWKNILGMIFEMY
jgi:hypothetical protein